MDSNRGSQSNLTDSDSASLHSSEMCVMCREQLYAIDEAYDELRQRHNACFNCNFQLFDLDITSFDFDSTEPSLGSANDEIFDVLSSTSSDTNDFLDTFNNPDGSPFTLDGLMLDLVEDELFSNDQRFVQNSNQEGLRSIFDETDEEHYDNGEFNETEIRHNPNRSTRSDIESYYETPIRSRFWTRRRNQSRARQI